jgi:hypothetical protein
MRLSNDRNGISVVRNGPGLVEAEVYDESVRIINIQPWPFNIDVSFSLGRSNYGSIKMKQGTEEGSSKEEPEGESPPGYSCDETGEYCELKVLVPTLV